MCLHRAEYSMHTGINRYHIAVVGIYKLKQAATGSSVICDTNNSSQAKQKHILATKPRKITTNIIHLLKGIVGWSIQKGPTDRSEVLE